MVLVIGGKCSGKSEFAKSFFNISDDDILTSYENIENLKNIKCIRDYHIIIRRICDTDKDPILFTEEFCRNNPDCIVITDEIGSGIVPIYKAERYWREAYGKSSCMLASCADTVIRVVCGIPTAIKGKL